MASDPTMKSFSLEKKAEHVLYQLTGHVNGIVTKNAFKYVLDGAAAPIMYTSVSEDAFKLLSATYPKYITPDGIVNSGQHYAGCIFEHTIPSIVMYNYLLNNRFDVSVNKFAELLKNYFIISLITKEEDMRLKAIGLNSQMPEGWTFENGDPLARYNKAGIIMHKW